MDNRKERILRAVIADYILNAEPIGSRTIAKKYDLGISPATVRNEMSDLEEMGYLFQPHTSAGRIPLEKAYRYYVNWLMQTGSFRGPEMQGMKDLFLGRFDAMDLMLGEAARLIHENTHYPTMILTDEGGQADPIRHVRLLPMGGGKVMILLVSESGKVSHRMMRAGVDFSESELEKISSTLSRHLSGQANPMQVLEEMSHAAREQRTVMEAVLKEAESQNEERHSRTVALKGTTGILDFPEFQDVNRARNLLSLLEDRPLVLKLLSDSVDEENSFSVSIGEETGIEGLKDCSLITATFRYDRDKVTSIGVIGPTRMDYAKVGAILMGLKESFAELIQE